MKTSIINVHDMLSVLSVEEVEKRIGEVPGVESVTVNYDAGNATVRYDETRLKAHDIKTIVRQRSYNSDTSNAAEVKKAEVKEEVPVKPIAVKLPKETVETEDKTQGREENPDKPLADDMDHSKMDHSKMDHSKMDDAKADDSDADDSKKVDSKVDDSDTDDSKKVDSKVDDSDTDDSKKDDSKVDDSKTDELKKNDSKVDDSDKDDSMKDESKADDTKKVDSKPDDSKMDHSKMDHSKMNDPKPDDSKMDHSKMDHSKMNDPKPDDSKMDHSKMDHSKMNDPKPDDSKMDHSKMDHNGHAGHSMKPASEMTFWEKLRMSMTMSMGMEHGGLAGREMAKMMELDIRNKFFVALGLTIPIILYSPLGTKILGINLPSPIPVPWLLFILTTPVYFYSGWIFLYSTYKALQAKTLNMAVLIAVGITAAYGFSVFLTLIGSGDSFYEAAAMLVTFVLFGHWMEMKSRRGTTDALQALFALVPPQARVFRNGKEEMIATAEVKLGEIVILKPGDKVPVDGEINEGETSIDESLVTGESVPVERKKGDKVIGGSINQSGSVRFTATKIGGDTALAQIVKMVEMAQNSKAPGQKLADRFARYLVIAAVGGGIITFVVWYFILGQPMMVALTFAISTIVIACPDALGLATPTAVAVGTGLGAKHNILIKDAATLEQTSKIQAVVMDKTGTLTEGKPKITSIAIVSGVDENKVLQYIGAAEAKSSHPLSNAVLEEINNRKLVLSEKVEKFQNLSGLGVKATVDGTQVLVGTEKLMNVNNIDTSVLKDKILSFQENGETIMLLALDGKLAGIVGAIDPIKENSKKAVERLKEIGIETAMITGDNEKTAQIVAKKIGITRVFADVMPEDKAKYVKKLQEEGKFVAMVGDGVNDAPALATADIGIAIGAGTDVAIETAKIVLMKSDPADILRAIRLSKATVRKMKQNLFWASIYNILAIPVAAGVLYPQFGISLRPEFAALLMSISSIIVATNAVLLKRAEKDLITV